MAGYLNFREKIEALSQVTVMHIDDIKARVEYGTATEDFNSNRVVCRRDIRSELAAAIAGSGLSQSAVARFLHIHPQHLNSYLRGKIAISNGRLEEILFLLDGRMLKEEERP